MKSNYKLYGLDLIEYDYYFRSGKNGDTKIFCKAYALNQSSLFFVTNSRDTLRTFQFVSLYIPGVSIRVINIENNFECFFENLIFENETLTPTKQTYCHFNDAKPFFSLKDAIKYKAKLELLK